MIKSIKHKGLKALYERGSTKGVKAEHVDRLKLRLSVLSAISNIEDINPGWDPHKLKGDKKGQWAIKVSGNYRLFFEFTDGDIYVLDYGDYH